MIGWIAKALGLNTLIVWALVALLGVGSVWGYGAVQYRAGKSDGAAGEALVWTQHMAELRAENEKRRRADQAEIDRIEAEYLAQQSRAGKAEADLAAARRASPTRDKIAVPRALAREINKVGRR